MANKKHARKGKRSGSKKGSVSPKIRKSASKKDKPPSSPQKERTPSPLPIEEETRAESGNESDVVHIESEEEEEEVEEEEEEEVEEEDQGDTDSVRKVPEVIQNWSKGVTYDKRKKRSDDEGAKTARKRLRAAANLEDGAPNVQTADLPPPNHLREESVEKVKLYYRTRIAKKGEWFSTATEKAASLAAMCHEKGIRLPGKSDVKNVTSRLRSQLHTKTKNVLTKYVGGVAVQDSGDKKKFVVSLLKDSNFIYRFRTKGNGDEHEVDEDSIDGQTDFQGQVLTRVVRNWLWNSDDGSKAGKQGYYKTLALSEIPVGIVALCCASIEHLLKNWGSTKEAFGEKEKDLYAQWLHTLSPIADDAEHWEPIVSQFRLGMGEGRDEASDEVEAVVVRKTLRAR